MSDESQVEESDELEAQAPSEIDTLKARAKLLGIKHHHNIGVKKLAKLIKNHLEGNTEEDEAEDKPQAKPAPGPVDTSLYKPEENLTPTQIRRRQKANAMRLVRIRCTCLNQDKKEWDGEVLSVGNRTLGTVKRFIPFNQDEPYHVEQIIYDTMKERKCTVMKTVTENGKKVQRKALINEFAIEVLPPLTPGELETLRKAQAARDGIE